jgi:hypothetical protein
MQTYDVGISDPLFLKIPDLMERCKKDCSRGLCPMKKECEKLYDKLVAISATRPLTRPEIYAAILEIRRMQKGGDKLVSLIKNPKAD